MKNEFDINIRSNKCAAAPLGYSIVVGMKRGIENICFSGLGSRIDLRPKEHKLIFKPSATGFKIGNIGPKNGSKQIGFRVTNKELVPNLLTYTGTFNIIKDDLRGYYYIDLDNPGGRNKNPHIMKKELTPAPITKPEDLEKSEWYTTTKTKQELVKAGEEIEFQKKYIEELEKENKLLKEEIIDMRGKITNLEKDLPRNTREELKNSCINAMREYLDAEEFKEAKTISELISIVFEGKKITH